MPQIQTHAPRYKHTIDTPIQASTTQLQLIAHNITIINTQTQYRSPDIQPTINAITPTHPNT